MLCTTERHGRTVVVDFFLLLVLAVISLMTMACGESAEEQIKREALQRKKQFMADSAAFKIAVTPTIDCLPLYVAEDEGLFQNAGLSVQLRLYHAQMDQDTSMMRGRVEAMTTDLVRAERMQHQGKKLRYVTATELGWQLLTNPTARIKFPSQLDDKMIAMTRYSATALLADLIVDSARIRSEKVFRIQVNDVEVRLNMLLTGIMDAMFLPEPQATAARLEGCPVLMESGQKDVWLGVLAVSDSIMEDSSRQHQVETLLRIYDAACDSIGKYGVRHYASLVSKRCGVQQAVADSIPNDILFRHVVAPNTSDIERARKWLGY